MDYLVQVTIDKPQIVDVARARPSKQDTIPETSVSTGPAGLTSIKVNLPLSGNRWVFAKTIIDQHETFPVQFSYINKTWKRNRLIAIILIVIILGAAAIAFRRRRARRAA